MIIEATLSSRAVSFTIKHYEELELPSTLSLEINAQGLLLESLRQRDEAMVLMQELPPLNYPLMVNHEHQALHIQGPGLYVDCRSGR